MATVSGQTLSQWLNISISYLRELSNSGVIKKVSNNKYDLGESIQSYINYKESQGSSDEGLTAVEIGEIFGVSDRTVRELATKGIVKKMAKGSYSLKASIKSYVEYIKNQNSGDAASETFKKKQLERELVELKLMEQKGNLHRSADIKQFIGDMLISFRNKIRAIPHEISKSLSIESDEKKIKAILGNKLDDSLNSLSEYNPEANDGS